MTYGPFENTGVLTAPLRYPMPAPYDLLGMMKDNDGWAYADRVDALANALFEVLHGLAKEGVGFSPDHDLGKAVIEGLKFFDEDAVEGLKEHYRHALEEVVYKYSGKAPTNTF